MKDPTPLSPVPTNAAGRRPFPRQSWLALAGLTGLALAGATFAQAAGARPPVPDAGEIVSWASAPVDASGHSRRGVVTVRGSIRDGWHVYGLKQSSNGPTPLVIAVQPNGVAVAAGTPTGSAPTVAFEPAFGFTTPFYQRSVSLSVPVRFRSDLPSGRHLVPISIRYQSCDGRICLPLKTVRLSAPVDVRSGS